jgi:ADP-ribose pyrophosphatase YjhB (NUDIX family)
VARKKQHERQTIVARAVILHRGKALLARMRDKAWYFLPGGHVEVGEHIEVALKRELKEEIGVRIRRIRFLGVHDNHFDHVEGERHHEIGIVFLVAIDRIPSRVLEPHITMEWVPLSALSRIHLLPQGIGSVISRALKTKRPFWMVRESRRKAD